VGALVRGGGVIAAETCAAGRRETEEPVRTAAAVGHRGPEEHGTYSWLEDHLARLESKEARDEYYAWLDR
jgi:hypothetical protein